MIVYVWGYAVGMCISVYLLKILRLHVAIVF